MTLKLSQQLDEIIQFVQKSSFSNTREKFYLTTAINYTNGKPHIGHAYEAITSDIICRYHRIYGRDVFFLTGTDEHGEKIATTAEKQNKTPIQLCDENVAWFKELNKRLLISYDRYIRTTQKEHFALAKKMFQIAYESGDIYFGVYEGWYNMREEHYVTEVEAKKTDYKDPVSGKDLIKHKEEAYFFKMSKYQDALIDHIKKNKNFIRPENAYNNILSRLEEKLDDLCVSRSSFSWGIPLPESLPHHEKHVMYVWFDALNNYLSGVDYFETNSNLHHFWPVNVHVIGRDIVWFHTVIWPCILMSCKVPLPQCVFCHGFVTDANGEKMSKSLGNSVDPFDMLGKYEVDTLRYFAATQATYGEDMRWNLEDLKNKHDAHLTHGFGNLVKRTLKLVKIHCDSKVPKVKVEKMFDLNELRNKFETSFSTYSLSEAANSIMIKIRDCNLYLADKAPWNMKSRSEEQLIIIRSALESIYIVAHFMEPFTPQACEKLFKYLNTKPTDIPLLNDNFENLTVGTTIEEGEDLFKQFDSKFQKKLRNQ